MLLSNYCRFPHVPVGVVPDSRPFREVVESNSILWGRRDFSAVRELSSRHNFVDWRIDENLILKLRKRVVELSKQRNGMVLQIFALK